MPSTTIKGRNVPIELWAPIEEVDSQVIKQLKNVAALPWVAHHVAVMPDVHLGKGATVGSVIAMQGAVAPAAVGVDIGCGMAAVRTTIAAADLPDSLSGLRSAIEAAVPHGRSDNGGRNDVGSWTGEPPAAVVSGWSELAQRYADILEQHPKVAHPRALGHLGTLGTGNHFVELCLDEADRL